MTFFVAAIKEKEEDTPETKPNLDGHSGRPTLEFVMDRESKPIAKLVLGRGANFNAIYTHNHGGDVPIATPFKTGNGPVREPPVLLAFTYGQIGIGGVRLVI